MRRFFFAATAGCAALALSGCAAPKSEGLYFVAPTDAAGAAQQSSRAPAEMADALRAAGFTDVEVINSGDTVRVRSQTNSMINCGAITQVAFGNQATFMASEPKTAILAEQQLYIREVSVSSSADLTLESVDIYTVSENHTVTLTYNTPTGTPISRQTLQFDQSGSARFTDGVLCMSGGAVAAAN